MLDGLKSAIKHLLSRTTWMKQGAECLPSMLLGEQTQLKKVAAYDR